MKEINVGRVQEVFSPKDNNKSYETTGILFLTSKNMYKRKIKCIIIYFDTHFFLFAKCFIKSNGV